MPIMHDNVLVYASDIEDATIEQAKVAARLPFVEGHIALMPDAHVGFGTTVGSVIPTKGAVIPYAIGVDIGCGMIAVQTSLNASQLPDDLGRLHGAIRDAVPAGMGKHNLQQGTLDFSHWPLQRDDAFKWFNDKQQETARSQFGTLGGGNHFVEISIDATDDSVWVVLHSGSRGIGNQLATQHIEAAKGLMKDYFIELENPDLAYLVEGTRQFDEYITAMLWAQDYAMGNRETMMDAVLVALAEATGNEGFYTSNDPASIPFEQQRINCHHNYTERENHNGANVWLTRKGAIRARSGDLGIIPGSMGTSTYIVEGLGNASSYNSCSHGAGRRLSRGKAHRELSLDAFRAQMTDAGITWDDRDAASLLDEAPLAYKDIERVIHDSRELVTVKHKLNQVLNYKGVDKSDRQKRRMVRSSSGNKI